MEIFGLKLGKNKKDQNGQAADGQKKSLKANLKHQAQKSLMFALRFQVSIIALAVAGLLAITALRMLHYMNPPTDETRVTQNLAKYKQTRIDPNIVNKIKQLQSAGTSTNTNLQNSRTNPFAE